MEPSDLRKRSYDFANQSLFPLWRGTTGKSVCVCKWSMRGGLRNERSINLSKAPTRSMCNYVGESRTSSPNHGKPLTDIG